MIADRQPGSFRDPGGFLYWRNGELLRQINQPSMAGFQLLIDSGLYSSLVADSYLIGHRDVALEYAANDEATAIIQPRLLQTISYPYEWSFSQLKDAALLTLAIQERALQKGLSLKDASAYNIQFDNAKPIFIDTLSFDSYIEGKPWVAYGQFCRHFLAPLALMSKVDVNLNKLLRTYIDGIPLSLAAKLIPFSAFLRPSLAMHIGLQARAEKQTLANRDSGPGRSANFSMNAFLGLIDSLRSAVSSLEWQPGGTEWFDYYEANNNYSEAGLEAKEELLRGNIHRIQPATVWDLGGNTGRFSRIARDEGANVTCFDIDPGCVEANYLQIKANQETGILPLLMDLGNPSPGIGWNNSERISLLDRGPADLVMALGLIHHLTIGMNVPFGLVAETFSRIAKHLIIEFVPRGDSQVIKLLSTRNDVFTEYDEDFFKAAFSQHYEIERCEPIPGTERTLFTMQTKRAR